jgi:hypothetical protein
MSLIGLNILKGLTVERENVVECGDLMDCDDEKKAVGLEKLAFL